LDYTLIHKLKKADENMADEKPSNEPKTSSYSVRTKSHVKFFDKTAKSNNQSGSVIVYHDLSKSFDHLRKELEKLWGQFVDAVQNPSENKSEPYIAKILHCFKISDYVQSYFCGTSPYCIDTERLWDIPKNIDDLKSNIITKLFAPFTFSDHKIFRFDCSRYDGHQDGAGTHSFCVEKIGDNQSTSYRVYEGWESRYSLMQWLGIGVKEDPILDQNSKEKSEQYGQGKLLSKKELKEFLGSTLTGICAPRISIYNVNHPSCDLVIIEKNAIHSNLDFKTIVDLPFTSNAAYVRYNNQLYYINRSQEELYIVSQEEKICEEFDNLTKSVKEKPIEDVIQKNGNTVKKSGISCRTLVKDELIMIQEITNHIHQPSIPTKELGGFINEVRQNGLS